jgi:hypothetical protein
MSTAVGKVVSMCQWWLELAVLGCDCSGGGGAGITAIVMVQGTSRPVNPSHNLEERVSYISFIFFP